MKKILVLLACSLLFITTFAQMPGGQRGGGGQQITGRFYGKIVDISNKGIEAASVTLVQDRMDTVTRQRREFIVGGMLTPASGEFSIENVPVMGRYKLRVTGIGFKTVEQNVAFEMPNRNGGGNNDPMAMLGALDKDLGNIKLEVDEKVLGGVTVTANRPALTMGIDRKVFNVDRNLVSQGGTAVDVMKNVPSVNVDLDGNVTVRNGSPQIFVDGRPTNLTLEQIPADAIESVEIITNPSAKFDASGGTAGILNIVLKKNKRIGYSGNVRANIDSRARVGFGGDINVRQNKVNFFLNGMLNQRKTISTGNTTRFTTLDSFYSVQNDRNVGQGQFGFLRGGVDIFLTNRNTLTLSGSTARGGMDPTNSSDIRIDTMRKRISERQSRTTLGDNNFRNWGTQLSFKHNFPKAGREWTADITLNKGRNENSNSIRTERNRVGFPNPEIYLQSQAGMGSNENLVFQTDYVNPINQNSKFEVGARTSIRKIENDLSVFISNKSTRTHYTNEDRVYAAYATYSGRAKNFGYQLGLRAESSDNQGVLNYKQNFKIEFPFSFFPSVFLSQKISDNDDLQLNYSRRINRPNFFQLFPFTDYSDSLNISRGNPDLDPEFTNSLELSYSRIFKNRDNFLASVYFKNTNDLITSIVTREEDTVLNRDTVLISSFVNANRSYTTGLELTSRNKITKWWDLTSNANFFTAKIDLQDQPDPEQFLSYFLKLNNTFRLPKNISLQLSGEYQSRIITNPGGRGGGGGFRGGMGGSFGGGFGGGQTAAQGFIRENYFVDAGIRFEFLKNRAASISLNVNDVLRTRRYNAHIESPFFTQDVFRRRDPQLFRLNFNWRFGKMDASLFKRRNTRAESEGMDGGMMQ